MRRRRRPQRPNKPGFYTGTVPSLSSHSEALAQGRSTQGPSGRTHLWRGPLMLGLTKELLCPEHSGARGLTSPERALGDVVSSPEGKGA